MILFFQHKKVESVPVKSEPPVQQQPATFDQNTYLKELKSAAKKWEEFFSAGNFSESAARPTLVEVYNQVSSSSGSYQGTLKWESLVRVPTPSIVLSRITGSPAFDTLTFLRLGSSP